MMIEIKKSKFRLINITPDEALANVNDLISSIKSMGSSATRPTATLALLNEYKANVLLIKGCYPNKKQGLIA